MQNKLQTITLTLFFIAGMMLSLGMVSADSQGAPERGHHIWGELRVNGEAAPNGTVVEARLDGNVLQSTTPNNSIYSFTISDNQNNDRDGETITIFIEDVEGESVPFQNSEITNLSFAVDGVTFGDQEDDSSDDDSGSSGSSGGSSGGSSRGFGSVTNDVNETENDTTETTSDQESNSNSEPTQETTETTLNVTTDDSSTDESRTEEETTEEPTQESNPLLDAMTGFVTGVGDQAGLTGLLFLIFILTGLVGGYIYYNSKE